MNGSRCRQCGWWWRAAARVRRTGKALVLGPAPFEAHQDQFLERRGFGLLARPPIEVQPGVFEDSLGLAFHDLDGLGRMRPLEVQDNRQIVGIDSCRRRGGRRKRH